MRKALVAGNWKMNGSTQMCNELLAAMISGVAGLKSVEVLVCPPFTLIGQVASALSDSSITLGGQNVSAEERGAFTGEVSADMLLDVGCEYVIVGHSERRARYGDSDAWVAQKARAAASKGLTPIVCVGETLEQRAADETEQVVGRQLGTVLDELTAAGLDNFVVAYEPVWAIGTGKTASSEQAQAVHAAIRAQLASVSEALAIKTRVLYGGSVKADNAATLFKQTDIDGGLIGGASLHAKDFIAICAAAA
ncbi:MAG: triose-phosphate isomerase [Arenicellales bacterium WSBS_2016_MAG_OTU3]